MFTLVFDPLNKALAAAMGRALLEYGTDATVLAVNTTAASKMRTAPEATIDAAADVEEYNEAETVKLSDSVAGLSESQSEISDETKVPETVQQDAAGVPDVDKNGVQFNAQFCAKAAKPFYASGKYAGQWKKGTKVEQAAYDAWYLDAVTRAIPPANDVAIATHRAIEPAKEFDTNNAFGAKDDTPGAEVSNTPPQGIGPFIMWSAEQQTAGFLTQNDISEAYTTLGISQADISPANPNAQANITALHAILNAKLPI